MSYVNRLYTGRLLLWGDLDYYPMSDRLFGYWKRVMDSPFQKRLGARTGSVGRGQVYIVKSKHGGG